MKYVEVAKEITKLIADGTLRPGDALPSVRAAARQKQLSKGTIVQAYSALERCRLIESRPQSGFYVRAPSPNTARLPCAVFSQPSVVRSNARGRMREMLYDLMVARA